VAARKPDRAVRAREQDSRDARAQGTGAAEIVAPRKVLDVKAARLAAGDLLSRRAWTRAELTARLRRRGAPPEIAAEIVADLVARGYIDDASYARHWVTTRAPRGYGVARLRAELRGRGVATAIIDAALGDVDAESSLTRAREVARRRLPALRRGRPERVASRLRDYLLRRGFTGSIVMRVVRECAGVTADD
jgi:regulatory protein